MCMFFFVFCCFLIIYVVLSTVLLIYLFYIFVYNIYAMCGVELKDRGKVMDWLLILGFIEAVGRLSMESSVCWHEHMC